MILFADAGLEVIYPPFINGDLTIMPIMLNIEKYKTQMYLDVYSYWTVKFHFRNLPKIDPIDYLESL